MSAKLCRFSSSSRFSSTSSFIIRVIVDSGENGGKLLSNPKESVGTFISRVATVDAAIASDSYPNNKPSI